MSRLNYSSRKTIQGCRVGITNRTCKVSLLVIELNSFIASEAGYERTGFDALLLCNFYYAAFPAAVAAGTSISDPDATS